MASETFKIWLIYITIPLYSFFTYNGYFIIIIQFIAYIYQSCQVVIRNESEILNVGMSKPPKVASRPAGGLGGAASPPAEYGAEPRSKKCVSKMKKKYYLKLKDMFFR